MIKETIRQTKYNIKKSRNQIIGEYLRTIAFSVLFAFIITVCLSVHARHEMIKNLYTSPQEQRNIDRQIATQFINANSDMLNNLSTQNYAVCMNVGSIYETVDDYTAAQIAYQFAKEKSKPDNFNAHYKLLCVLLAQNKFEEAEKFIENIDDYTSKNLIKFKTRSYIVMGDKYYSIGKFISAGKNYEKAAFYYNKFAKQDKKIVDSIELRIKNAYIQSADTLVKMGYNSEAVKFLKKVEKITPDDLKIKYKLAVVLSDSDPEKSVEYLEVLLKKAPQYVDYAIFGNALMKAANIADLEGRQTQAKLYRYKIHSIDMFLNRKVIYRNDIDVILKPIPVKKKFLTYPIKLTYSFINASNTDIVHLKTDLVLSENDNPIESYTAVVASKDSPLYSIPNEPNSIEVKFKHKVFTKKDLAKYTVKIYIYKDEKFKTLVAETRIPTK